MSEIFELPLQFILCLYIISYMFAAYQDSSFSLQTAQFSYSSKSSFLLQTVCKPCKISHVAYTVLNVLSDFKKGDATSLQKTYSNNAENWILTFLGSYPKNLPTLFPL